MSDRKPCVRCSRQIDAYARICPYCNWEQSEVPPAPERIPAAELQVPREHPWRNKALAGAAFIALLVIAFVVGWFVHGFDASEVKAAQSKSSTAAAQNEGNPTPPSNVTLVPVSDSEGTAPIVEPPLTSVPPSTTAQEPNDTTALPSTQYAAAAARARAQQKSEQQRNNDLTDPRALTGAPTEPPSSRAEPSEQSASVPESRREPARTTAFPEYKPLPRLNLDRDMTARLTVTVAPDGRVTDIEVNQPVPQMPRVIAAVQNWRFRPATENGTPVTARVAVDIIFRGNG